MPAKPDPASSSHYQRLAGSFDANWAYSPGYITWMTRCLLRRAAVGPDDLVADIGCGTGLYSRGLAAITGHVICVDPSPAMLAQLPSGPEYTPVEASAEDIANGEISLSKTPLDAIIIKEAVHHIPASERPRVLASLAALLAPGGRIVIAMLPEDIGYPLFRAALDLFEERQPHPADIASILTAAGLDTTLDYEGYSLTFPRDQYIRMVRNKYMSLLSEFTDEQIEAGIKEITDAHPGDRLHFADRFAFITATQLR